MEGEELTITYCPPLLSTAARREKLLRSKFFSCKCDRCSNDPTEMGTHLGSLLCPKVTLTLQHVWWVSAEMFLQKSEQPRPCCSCYS